MFSLALGSVVFDFEYTYIDIYIYIYIYIFLTSGTWDFGARALSADENEKETEEEERRARSAAGTPLSCRQNCAIAGAISPAACFGFIACQQQGSNTQQHALSFLFLLCSSSDFVFLASCHAWLLEFQASFYAVQSNFFVSHKYTSIYNVSVSVGLDADLHLRCSAVVV